MLQEIINIANLGLVVVGPDLDIRLWNKWMVQATGVDAETACYKRIDQILPDTVTQDVANQIRKAIDDGVGAIMPLSDIGMAKLSGQGDIAIQPVDGKHYVHAMRPVREEISDRLCLIQFRSIRASQPVQYSAPAQQDDDAEFPENARLEFLATVGHQIRTPVNGVLGAAELLHDTDLSKMQHRYVDLLLRSANALQTFVNELTDLSYLEAGRVQLEQEVTDAPVLLRDVMDMFATTGANKGIKAQLDLAEDFPKYIRTDHQKLRQLLAILVGNAFKFTHHGCVGLKASVDGEGDEARLLLEVWDTGVGIPQNRLGSLFDPLKPTESENRYFNRTGLGLYLGREIIDLFGGTVEVESAVGQGSRFRVRVPTEIVGRLEYGKAAHLRPEERKQYGSWRVLLAEDNPVNQMMFQDILERQGHEVVVVSNGQEAVAAVQMQQGFDIVLMDIAMPVMDGMEATALIRSLFGPAGHTPILALTAHALDGDREIFLDAGMDGYQSKPVDGQALEAAMARAIATRKALKRWPGSKGPTRSARPASGPMSWLRFPKLGRRRESDRVDQ